VTQAARVVEGIVGRFGVSLSWFPALASVEIAGAGPAWVHVPAGKGGLAGIERLDATTPLPWGYWLGMAKGSVLEWI
jgi:hypothetical protein